MKKVLFIVLNIISVLIEYSIIYLFFRFVLKKIFLISIIMTLLIFIIMSLIVIYANYALRKTSIEDKDRPCEEELLKIVNKTSSLKHKKIYLHYVSAPQPNPAWCVGNHVYINNQYRCPDLYLPGVIAHELGHVVSGISNFTFIPSLKVSTILSRVLQLSIMGLVSSSKKGLKMLAYVLFLPYYIINLNNLIFTYHFLIEDELIANKFACRLGYGEHLRCYYGQAVNAVEDPLFRKSDLMHPSINVMLDEMNKQLKIKPENENIYYIGEMLIFAYVNTKTFIVPPFITKIYNDAFNNQNLLKITGENVTKVYPNAFRKAPNLEQINMKNVLDFPIGALNRLTKLNNIKINNLEILKEIYYKYPNRLFSDKIYKILLKNNVLKED